MDTISIIFFLIGSWFGFENPQIMAEHVDVQIHTSAREVHICAKNIFIFTPENEEKLIAFEKEWNVFADNYFFRREKTGRNFLPEISNSPIVNHTVLISNRYKTKLFNLDNGGKTVAVVNLSFHYMKDEYLNSFGLYFSEGNKIKFINVPGWNLSQKPYDDNKAELVDGYWVFDAKRLVRFSLAPYTKISEEQKNNIYSLYGRLNKLRTCRMNK